MVLNGKRVAYWLNHLEPGPNGTFRVCLITEDESGYCNMGDEKKGQQPWFWDEETCKEQNRRLGNSDEDTWKIVASSMFVNFNF